MRVGDKIQPHLHVVSPGGRSCAADLRSHGRANEALVFYFVAQLVVSQPSNTKAMSNQPWPRVPGKGC